MSEVSSAPAPAPAADVSSTPSNDSVGTTATEVAQDEVGTTEEPSIDEVASEPELTPQEHKELVKELKKWKLKSNGKEREVTDENEMIRLAQLGLGANEKFEQAAKTRKEAEQVISLLQSNPAEALKRLGLDVRALAEDYLYKEIQNEKLTPEQKKMNDMEAQLAQFKAEKEEARQQQEAQHFKKLQAEYEVSLQDNIVKAIDQYKLPNNPRTIARIAEYMARALENGVSIDPLDVAPRVRADLEQEHKYMYSHYGVEDILKLIGDDKAKAIRQYDVQKIKAKAPVAPVKTEAVAHTPKTDEGNQPKKGMTIAEMMAEIEKEIG